VPTCAICGRDYEPEGYHVVVDGEPYDSMECALRAQAASRRRRADATSAWVSAARRHLGIPENSPNVEREHDDH